MSDLLLECCSAGKVSREAMAKTSHSLLSRTKILNHKSFCKAVLSALRHDVASDTNTIAPWRNGSFSREEFPSYPRQQARRWTLLCVAGVGEITCMYVCQGQRGERQSSSCPTWNNMSMLSSHKPYESVMKIVHPRLLMAHARRLAHDGNVKTTLVDRRECGNERRPNSRHHLRSPSSFSQEQSKWILPV
jgi:hypothetical protein